MTAAPEPAARPSRWVDTLLLVVVAAMLLDILVGVAVWVATGRNTLLAVMAVFLVLSGVRLVGIAVDTLQRVRAAAPGEALVRGWGWIAYKLVAAVIAFAAAGYLLLAPDAQRLATMFGN